MHRSAERLGAALVLLLSASCVPDGVGPETLALTPVTIQAQRAPADVGGIAVEISGPGIGTALLVNLVEGAGNSWSGSIEVPVGDDRLFVGRAFDDAGEMTHEGETTVDVGPGNNPPVALSLLPLGDDAATVPISVTVEDHSVTVSPAAASVAVNGKKQFTEEVEGSSCTPQWASSNPGVATVDANGLATGLAPGEALIVVNCGGVAAAATLTVT